jgi:hypothetical protein
MPSTHSNGGNAVENRVESIGKPALYVFSIVLHSGWKREHILWSVYRGYDSIILKSCIPFFEASGAVSWSTGSTCERRVEKAFGEF